MISVAGAKVGENLVFNGSYGRVLLGFFHPWRADSFLPGSDLRHVWEDERVFVSRLSQWKRWGVLSSEAVLIQYRRLTWKR